jgi:hypothetical protein
MKNPAGVLTKMILLAAGLSLTAMNAQEQELLKPFVGKWSALICYTGTGGRVTVSRTDDMTVSQPEPNVISFSAKPMVADKPVFATRLDFVSADKTFVLSIKTEESPAMLEKVVLRYDSSSRVFSGEGTITDVTEKSGKVKVAITPTANGGYEWSVKDPAAPKDNDTVVEITFLKRLD